MWFGIFEDENHQHKGLVSSQWKNMELRYDVFDSRSNFVENSASILKGTSPDPCPPFLTSLSHAIPQWPGTKYIPFDPSTNLSRNPYKLRTNHGHNRNGSDHTNRWTYKRSIILLLWYSKVKCAPAKDRGDDVGLWKINQETMLPCMFLQSKHEKDVSLPYIENLFNNAEMTNSFQKSLLASLIVKVDSIVIDFNQRHWAWVSGAGFVSRSKNNNASTVRHTCGRTGSAL